SSKIDTEITSKVSDETIINENNKDNILQPIDTENQFQEIKNVTLIRSHNITIGRSEKLSIIALGAKQIFRPTPPSCSLNSKPDYNHSMTTSENRVMDFQSIMQKNSKTRLPPMKLFLIDMDEATKHASSCCIGHPAISWSFAKLVTGKSGTGKTNIFGNLVFGDKAKYIYKKKKGRSRYIWCDNLIVCGYHPDEPKWAFIRYIYGIIASNPRASYYENI
ncbi:24481_t:CDS:2, partial [Cetraspora pellucida]